VRSYPAVIERCSNTNLFARHVPGIVGAHSQGATCDELHANLKEVIAMLLGNGGKIATRRCASALWFEGVAPLSPGRREADWERALRRSNGLFEAV
jgi:predicted RNase H-like HicB family nuclease